MTERMSYVFNCANAGISPEKGLALLKMTKGIEVVDDTSKHLHMFLVDAKSEAVDQFMKDQPKWKVNIDMPGIKIPRISRPSLKKG